jgi:hypothetical protein
VQTQNASPHPAQFVLPFGFCCDAVVAVRRVPGDRVTALAVIEHAADTL